MQFPEWNSNADAAIAQAITEFGLIKSGWRGFEQLTWVAELKAKYPVIEEISTYASSETGCKLTEVTQLLTAADREDRPAILSYFVGKLALEKLSCSLSGAGAGMCDKFSAYLQIFDLIRGWQ